MVDTAQVLEIKAEQAGRKSHWHMCRSVAAVVTMTAAATYLCSRPAELPRAMCISLATASLVQLFEFHARVLRTIQIILGLYLCSAVLNLLILQRMSLTRDGTPYMVSPAVLAVLALSIGELLSFRSRDRQSLPNKETITCVLAVVAAHAAFLWVLLSMAYGHGYEHSLRTMAILCVTGYWAYLFWPVLQRKHSRRLLGVIGIVFYAVYAFQR